MYDIIRELQNEPGLNKKKEILSKHKDNQELKNVLRFVYHPLITSGISEKKISKKINSHWPSIIPKTLTVLLSYLENNNTGKDKDIYICKKFLETASEKDRLIIKDIITQKLNIGMAANLLNEVYGENFILNFPIMQAYSYWGNEKKIKKFFITQKLDGIRALIKCDEKISIYSKKGIPIEGLEDLEKAASTLQKGFFYDGELLVKGSEKMDSKMAYNLTSKILRKKGKKDGVVFHCFDIIDIKSFYAGYCETAANIRKENIHSIIGNKYDLIKEVPVLYSGEDQEKIFEWLSIMGKANKEGIMVNVLDGPYEGKRSYNILKVKVFKDCDVKVISILEGTGENQGKLGSVEIEFIHENQIHKCFVGSGFSKEQRELFFKEPEKIVGKIIKVSYFEITKNEKGGYGLRFPTFKEIREDKKEISME